MAPQILVLGQITVDDTVPAQPGPWHRRLGGNALYAAAGARLWSQPQQVGVVARVAAGLPFDVADVLAQGGLSARGLVPASAEPLIEWIVYEEDGNRQSMPRNAALRDAGANPPELLARYLAHIESLSATSDDIPAEWLPAQAIHLAPQVLSRHLTSCRALAGQCAFLSVDPSPHYTRGSDPEQLAAILPGVTAFLPSQAEVQHFAALWPHWPEVALALQKAGFAEVVLKRGSAGAVLVPGSEASFILVPVAPAKVLDLTGAGDAFSGAYAASRGQGHAPFAAAARAAVAAAMVVECAGTQAALTLDPKQAEARLQAYLSR